MRTKICGIGSLDDALCAVDAGADALGFVFYKPSPRFIGVELAREICTQLPPFVDKVGLFVNHTEDEVQEIIENVPLSLLQFHGDESAEDCRKYDLPYIKAVRVQSENDVLDAEAEHIEARALLVDAYREGVPGGTGETFDWGVLPVDRKKPIILAGGLRPSNVRKAIRATSPYAVDVSGGVELRKGVKDHNKIKEFIDEVFRECQS